MPVKRMPDVLPTYEAREQLSKALARFRESGARSEPLFFGAHRRPEAAIVPFALLEELLPILDDIWIASEANERLSGDTGQRLSFDDVSSALGLRTSKK